MADPWDKVPVVSRARGAKKATGQDPWVSVPVVDGEVMDAAPPAEEAEAYKIPTGQRLGEDGKPYSVANRSDTTETPEELTAQGYRQDSNGTWFKMVADPAIAGQEAEKPEWQQKLGAFAQGAVEQIPFLDEAAAFTAGKLYGRPYSEMRQVGRDLDTYDREYSSGSRLSGQVAGVAAGLAAPGGGYIRGADGLQAVGRAAQVGAGYGGLYGVGQAEGSLAERLPSGALGAVTGAVTGAGLQAVGNSIGRRLSGISGAGQRPPAPKLDQLQAARTGAYTAVDNSGAIYSKDQIRGLGSEVKAALTQERVNPLLHPKATAMLRTIERQGDDMSLTELDQLRQVIRRDVVNSGVEGEAYMGRKMIDKLDEFIDAAAPAEGPENAGGLITRARDLNTRVSKIEDINNAVDAAKLQAGASGSGGNVNNAIRQKLKSVLTRRNNFTPEEREALEGIVVGTRGQNLLRWAGKLSPEGNGLMLGLQTAGALASGGVSAPLMAVGAVSKRLADRQTITAVERLVDDIARGAEGVPVEEQTAARALIKLKDVDLTTYRAAVAQLASRLAAQNDNGLLTRSAAASTEEPPPGTD